MYITSDSKLPKVVILSEANVVNVFESAISEGEYVYTCFEVPSYAFNYANLVDLFITSQYPNDKMQAVVNNYLLDPTNEDSLRAFNHMQDFRKKAKAEAKDCIDYYRELLNEKEEKN